MVWEVNGERGNEWREREIEREREGEKNRERKEGRKSERDSELEKGRYGYSYTKGKRVSKR